MLTRRKSIQAVFFLHAFAGGGLFPRTPDIQAELGLDKATLGLALMGQPVGTLLSILTASYLIERRGTKPLLAAGLPAIARPPRNSPRSRW